MKSKISVFTKSLLLSGFLIGIFGEPSTSASAAIMEKQYDLACTFTGDRTNLCYFYLNGSLATADGCCQGGATCAVIIP